MGSELELVRITVDIPEEHLAILQREAEKQHRSRKDQLEYIIESWVENHSREKH